MARKKPGKVGENKSEIVREIPLACADEVAAIEFMEKRRWGDDPTCACCDSSNVYPICNRKTGEREKHFRWRCRDCGKMFSVRKGTVFEDSKIPMRHWCFAFWAACSSKKGVSAKQIQRQTGLSYKSALFLLHRIRFAMAPDRGDEKLTGIVEADETYVGGKPRHKGWNRGARHKPRPNWSTKTPVMAMVQRGGTVRAMVVPTINSANMRAVIREHVDTSARLITDEHRGYRPLGREYSRHDRISHSTGEYARGDITTNTVEGFFALVKRGLYGTYHSVSKAHLHRYIAEFEFRYNHRKDDDGARTEAAIRASVGRRLLYREPIRA